MQEASHGKAGVPLVCGGMEKGVMRGGRGGEGGRWGLVHVKTGSASCPLSGYLREAASCSA